MEDDILENARRQAEKAEASIRAAALLRIARAASAGDLARARRTLLEGLDAVQELPPTPHEFALYSDTRAVRGLVHAVTITLAQILKDRILEQPLRDALDRELTEREHVPAAKDSWWIGTTVNDTGVLLSMIVAKSRSIANVLAREDDDS